MTPGARFRQALKEEKPLQVVGAICAYYALMAKRCGHRPGKELVSKDEMCDRIRAAVDARGDDGFVIMARTDALAGEGLEPALERAKAYVDAGADMLFPEAIPSIEMFRKFADAVKAPILANITEFGKTPLFALEE